MTPAPSAPDSASAAQAGSARRTEALQLLGLLDLTLLDPQASAADIANLCQLAANRHRPPAALCVGVEHVALARGLLDRLRLPRVAIATVANFPDGSADLGRIEREARQAIDAGADELDAVLPYRALCAGDLDSCRRMLQICRDACGGQALLKVIIESGELADEALIRRASELCIEAGADFLKTSTGLAPINATLPAARTMLQAIHAAGGRCGFKAAGGIRSLEQARAYVALAEQTLGTGWIGPGRFRIGASALLHELLEVLEGAPEMHS
jgi:deoxyribose-phosphate aldolase